LFSRGANPAKVRSRERFEKKIGGVRRASTKNKKKGCSKSERATIAWNEGKPRGDHLWEGSLGNLLTCTILFTHPKRRGGIARGVRRIEAQKEGSVKRDKVGIPGGAHLREKEEQKE